jgi:hypothetical protein
MHSVNMAVDPGDDTAFDHADGRFLVLFGMRPGRARTKA